MIEMCIPSRREASKIETPKLRQWQCFLAERVACTRKHRWIYVGDTALVEHVDAHLHVYKRTHMTKTKEEAQ